MCRPGDAEAVDEILTGANVIRGTMRMPYAALDHTRRRIEPAEDVVKLVAEADGHVVGSRSSLPIRRFRTTGMSARST